VVVKNDMYEEVTNDRNETVQGSVVEQVGADRDLTVTGKEDKEVGGDQMLTVKGNVTETFKGDHAEQTTMNYKLKALKITVQADTMIELKVGGSSITLDPAMIKLNGGIIKIN
jgi:type VI secretion system secreted protein VgrG